MGDGSLSQEEIDALLTGADEIASPPSNMGGVSAAPPPPPNRPPNQYPFVLSALSEAMNMASSSMTALVGKNITFTNPTSSLLNKNSIANTLEPQGVIVSTEMSGVTTIISLPPKEAGRIAMNIMGSMVEPTELDDAHLSSLNELCDTMISTIANQIGQKFSESITASPSEIKIFTSQADLPNIPSPNVVQINFGINIDGAPLGKFFIFMDESGPKRWSQNQNGSMNKTMNDMNSDIGNMGEAAMSDDLLQGFTENASAGGAGQTMNPVNFPTFQTSGSSQEGMPSNYDLLLDVQMVLTVELGRTTKYVKDVLKLGEGSIIELDKLAGEPVDLLINGKLIAKGEVVVIDENFGVRVTDIVAPAKRLAQITS